MTDGKATQLDENTRRYYLDVMGIQCWESIDVPQHDSSSESKQPDTKQREDAGAALRQLATDVSQCTKCRLHTSRRQAITGRGNAPAALMFVFIAPDVNDDAAAQLCSGEANMLFSKMLAAINIAIDDVYITSLLKCAVPPQHTITTTELHYCKDFLVRQLQLVQPKLLVVLGETAARCLLQQDATLDELRGRINSVLRLRPVAAANNAADIAQFESVPLFVSYSPHELLRQPADKRKAWQDLQQLQKLIEV
jgi:DNA polymerase